MSNPTQTMTLADFLLARIAEDEQSLAAMDGLWDTGNEADFAERVLAECEAKRQIVAMEWHHLGDDDYAWGMEEAKRQILVVLALPYADHPDYREEWRV